MIAERWKRMESVFQAALPVQASEREFFVDGACAGDRELACQVKVLLARHEDSAFLKQGVATAALRAMDPSAVLEPGDRLGPYLVESFIASGGMGAVYRALDTRLQRPVAIKVLRFAEPGEHVRVRLKREAQSIAKLQHPNICALHDLGEQDGRNFLVMEFLGGETLAERLQRGRLSLETVLEYATQIAAALEQAHRNNIVHRDLKPGNVMITKTSAKLLDFGLASLQGPSLGDAELNSAVERNSWGPLAGTLPYMAPEQIRGELADARTDIFAFGLVLYEMLTGRRAFEQQDRKALCSAILNNAAPSLPGVSTPLARVVDLCLAKDPDDRWQNAGDLKHELAWIAGRSAPEPARRHARWWTFGVALFFASTVAAGIAGYRMHTARAPQTVQFSLPVPKGAVFRQSTQLALSPNGERLVFGATGADGKAVLWVHPLSQINSEVIPGTEGGWFPFWSPDSKYVAFFAEGFLKKVDPSGGPVERICEAPNGVGGAWGPDDTIIFAPKPFTELHRVSAAGGHSKILTVLDPTHEDFGHVWPSFLPDGKHFLFTSLSLRHVGTLHVGSLDNVKIKALRTSYGRPVYMSGRLYFPGSGVQSQEFDLARLELKGSINTIAPRTSGPYSFDIAKTGTLVYRPGTGSTERDLIWVDRAGKASSSPVLRGKLLGSYLSPTGTSIASVIGPELSEHIEISKRPNGEQKRLTQSAVVDAYPVWSPDGKRIAFASQRRGHSDVFVKTADGTGEDEPVFLSDTDAVPRSWSADGRYIGSTQRVGKKYRMWITPLFGSRKPFVFMESDYSTSMPDFSLDGKWVAYWSDETGHAEIFVARFPTGTEKKQVTRGGGTYPRWRRDGKELFYVDQKGTLMATQITAHADALSFGGTKELFDVLSGTSGDPYWTADGKRFLVLSDPAAALPRPISVVLNAAPAAP